MNVTFEKKDNVTGLVTVSIEENDYKQKVKHELSNLSARRPIKGFRPGHAPMSLLQKMYGGEVTSQVVDRLVSEEMWKYLRENKIRTLGDPLLAADTHVDMLAQKDFEFKFDVALRPEFEIDVKKVEIPYYNIDVTDKMIDERDAAMRKSYGKEVDGEVVGEESMMRGAIVELDEKGKAKEDGVNEERAFVMLPRFKDDEQKALFVGKKKDDKIVFNPLKAMGDARSVAVLLHIDDEAAATKTGDFEFTIGEIKVHQDAELGQEYFDELFGKDKVTSEEQYREKLKEQLAMSLVGESNYRFTVDAHKCISAAAGEFEMPTDFLRRLVEMHRLEDGKPVNAEELDKEMPAMVNETRWMLVRDEIMEQLDVKVTDDDVKQMARQYAMQQLGRTYGYMMPDDIINRYADNLLAEPQNRQFFVNQAQDEVFYAAVRKNAKVKEQTVSPEDFNKLFEDEVKQKEQAK